MVDNLTVTLMLWHVELRLGHHPWLRSHRGHRLTWAAHHMRSAAHVGVWLARPAHCRGGDVMREPSVTWDDHKLTWSMTWDLGLTWGPGV